MSTAILQCILYLGILVALAIPLGAYIGKIMNGEKVFLTRILGPVENFMYRILHIDQKEQMGWKKYALCIVFFSAFGFLFLFLLNILQSYLPLNPEKLATPLGIWVLTPQPALSPTQTGNPTREKAN